MVIFRIKRDDISRIMPGIETFCINNYINVCYIPFLYQIVLFFRQLPIFLDHLLCPSVYHLVALSQSSKTMMITRETRIFLDTLNTFNLFFFHPNLTQIILTALICQLVVNFYCIEIVLLAYWGYCTTPACLSLTLLGHLPLHWCSQSLLLLAKSHWLCFCNDSYICFLNCLPDALILVSIVWVSSCFWQATKIVS